MTSLAGFSTSCPHGQSGPPRLISRSVIRNPSGIAPPEFPGIDADPRVTILLADLHGLGGYFTVIDNEPASIERFSNQRKLIYLDISVSTPGTAAFNGYLAHEFQHLTRYAVNPTADAWINEGLSEVVREQLSHSLLNIPIFANHPDTQLNDWPTLDEGPALANYGAAHSFLRYLLQHEGGIERAGRLAAQPGDGIAQVRAYLRAYGDGAAFEDVFADWLAANLVNDPAGGRFGQNAPAMRVNVIDTLAVPSETDLTVHQFGARYLSIDSGPAPVTIDVSGATTVDPLPIDLPSGRPVWWSARGDSIDTTLTHAIDLRGVTHATLNFRTWFEIERDYDYGYLEASADGGSSWTVLQGTQSSNENPLGIALGPAYTGNSGNSTAPAWVDEAVDLSHYAGHRVLLRFEYVTDEGANRNGWAIDQIRVPELGATGELGNESGWLAQGFRRLDGLLPQRFIVQSVLMGAESNVERVQLDQQNHASIRVPGGTQRVVLIVAGATDQIRTPARFHVSVRPS